MAGKVRTFTTLPVAAIGDDRLHAVDIRVLASIALHDGMSLVRGTGGGCYARHKTLAEEVGIDYARFSKSLRRLREFGYVQVEEQSNDRRRKTMRVPYPKDGSRPIGPEIVVTSDNHLVDMVDNETGEIVVKRESENPANPGIPKPLIYSVKQELDSEESGEIDSIEMAHRGDAGCNEQDVSRLVQATIGSLGHRVNRQELPTCGISIYDLLPSNWNKLQTPAQVSRLEAALQRIGKDLSRLQPEHSGLVLKSLRRIADDFPEEKFGRQADRLLCELEDTAEANAA